MPTPQPFYIPFNRRRLLQALALATGGLWSRGALAEALTITPRMTEGPFYPDKLPLDRDNDLVKLGDDLTPAIGIITNLSGRVVGENGEVIKGALVELWQADDHGNYIHTRGEQTPPRDAHFQGYGRFETAGDGGWKFRTIKPAIYPGRTRHFHFGVTLPGQSRRFNTQLFFAGEPLNARDGILTRIKDERQRASVLREFQPVSGTQEIAATWDIVMGLTPSDDHEEDERPPGPPPGGGRGPRPRDGGERRPPPQ